MLDENFDEEVQKEIQKDLENDEETENIEITEEEIIEIENEIEENVSEIETSILISNINEEESESDLDIYFKFSTNNHKLEGKHSLKRDTIFNGKIDVVDDNGEYYGQFDEIGYSFSESPLEKGTVFEEESRNSEEFLHRRNLASEINLLLETKTCIDFKLNRRKPNKTVFNDYYKMLVHEIGKKYTKSEIFVELSYYFTDNIFNMYKLLDKSCAMGIIRELREKGYLSDMEEINFL
jgi:hypothetical protein